MNTYSIGIVGHKGMVGGTTYRYFKDKGYVTFGYDLAAPQQKSKVFSADVVFVCVPTPYLWDKKKTDLSIVHSVLKEIPDGKTVVVKSTIPVGTTDSFQKAFPKLKILFNPEFLSEATSDMDFRNPDRQIVGYTKVSYPMATKVLNLLPESPYDIVVPAKEAELVKYMNNLHGMLEIMESNHFWEVCEKEKLDYSRVMGIATASKWVGAPMGRHYREIFHKGFRGFGGKCFPKDLAAWLEYCKVAKIDSSLFDAVRAMNKRILSAQEITEASSEKK